jgi:Domain of Unknown Function (DUF1080)
MSLHRRRGLAACAFLAIALAACAAPPHEAPQALNPEQRAAGWRTLFDGSGVSGWRNFRGAGVNPGWTVEDGALTVAAPGAGDIITIEQFENFELAFEWRISEGGNSGVFFNVVEGDHDTVWRTGPEYQLLDDARHADGAEADHRAGANYDLDAPSAAASRPVGEWNEARLIVDHGHVQHWLNGQLIVDYQLWTPQWEAKVAASKFATMPDYGRAHSGHIALQDHGDRVWFRNIRLRAL